uniref:(northern house mosquito) hypothetical protein n=1 Tax=Culex pipiens TaxID=7175 RepID=A0A8D8NML1_CULPI
MQTKKKVMEKNTNVFLEQPQTDPYLLKIKLRFVNINLEKRKLKIECVKSTFCRWRNHVAVTFKQIKSDKHRQRNVFSCDGNYEEKTDVGQRYIEYVHINNYIFDHYYIEQKKKRKKIFII